MLVESVFIGGIFTYFAQSNFIGKLIVLILLGSSFLGWTVMIGKHLDLKQLRTLNLALEKKLISVKGILPIDSNKLSATASPYALLLRDAVQAFSKHNHGLQAKEDVTIPMGHVENALARGVAKQSIRYESRMVVLGSIVTAAPFMGLLGTVWGVMDAFGSMTGQSSATIQSLAPGVSGALLTTVAGLLVAIPSVIGYNFLLSQTKLCITELENFASTLADRLELEMFEQVAEAQQELVTEQRESKYVARPEDEETFASDEDSDDDPGPAPYSSIY